MFVRTCSSGVCPCALLRRWLNWASVTQSWATGEHCTGMDDLQHSLIHNWHAGVVSFKPKWFKRHLASLISIPISPPEEWLNIKDGRRTRVPILALPFFSFLSYTESVSDWIWCRESKIVYYRLILEADNKRYIYIFIHHVLASGFPNTQQFELDGST